MATPQNVLYAYSPGNSLEQITETAGGSAPTAVVELNVKSGATREEVTVALEQLHRKVIQSQQF
tara:strand:- start:2172 stop:2363 length:192 start_codon:yes stop_codon:yes gene_type:complete